MKTLNKILEGLMDGSLDMDSLYILFDIFKKCPKGEGYITVDSEESINQGISDMISVCKKFDYSNKNEWKSGEWYFISEGGQRKFFFLRTKGNIVSSSMGTRIPGNWAAFRPAGKKRIFAYIGSNLDFYIYNTYDCYKIPKEYQPTIQKIFNSKVR